MTKVKPKATMPNGSDGGGSGPDAGYAMGPTKDITKGITPKELHPAFKKHFKKK